MKTVKCVIIGDGAVGKTSILVSYTTNSFLSGYVPTVFDNYSANCLIDNNIVRLSLWDTAGEEDYDRLRPLSYHNTDIFLATFSIISPVSLANIKQKWIPEITHFAPNIPYILIGAKSDLRHDENVLSVLKERNLKPLSYEQGKNMSREIKAAKYMECSSMHHKGVGSIFDQAIRIALNSTAIDGKKHLTKKSRCVII